MHERGKETLEISKEMSCHFPAMGRYVQSYLKFQSTSWGSAWMTRRDFWWISWQKTFRIVVYDILMLKAPNGLPEIAWGEGRGCGANLWWWLWQENISSHNHHIPWDEMTFTVIPQIPINLLYQFVVFSHNFLLFHASNGR